jgi:hypothetical protein
VSEREAGLPIEQFIHALTSQLDRAQSALALKARAGLPLTFAVKDLSLDLRTHVEMVGSVVRIRPAGPGEAEASILHLALTTITRPMIEENTMQLAADPNEPSLKEVLGSDVSEDDQRRLEWAGIHTVEQLREVQRTGGENAIERVAQIPVVRLRAALERASQPRVAGIFPESLDNDDSSGGTTLLRVRGQNLMRDQAPAVRIGGEQVPVLRATEREVVVAPLPHQLSGTLAVETAPGTVAQKEFDCRPPAPTAPKEAPTKNGGGP